MPRPQHHPPQLAASSVVFDVDGAGRAQILGFAGAVLVGRVGGVGVQKFDESAVVAVTEYVGCGPRTLLGSDTGFVGDDDLQRGSYCGGSGLLWVGLPQYWRTSGQVKGYRFLRPTWLR
jgi:hypothetical protein